jgi:flagellar hook-associated protein 1
MSLSSVLQIAQNSLANMTRRTGVLARNVNDSNSEYYARRDLQTITLQTGAQTTRTIRATDLRLERASIEALSSSAGYSLLSGRLDALNAVLAGEEGALRVTDQLTALHDTIQTYSGAADNELLGTNVIDSARKMVAELNDATKSVQDFRLGIDKEIGQTVKDLNALLKDFEGVNNEIKQGTKFHLDVNDALDLRSELLNKIAEIVPISPLVRDNNDIVLLTATGATLFETEPRVVNFTPQTALAPGSSGNPVFVDSVQLNFASTAKGPVTAKLDGLLRLRDSLGPDMQKQLDETARALVSAFAETDVTGSSLPPLQGLFTWSGGPRLPPAGTLVNGLAGNIAINPAYDPAAGGSATRLRDAASNGASYNANPTGLPAFADRLIDLARQFDAPQSFDSAAGLGSDISLVELSSQSSGWLSGQRSNASNAADTSTAKSARIRESFSNQTGVNIDIEMAKLGELENGYQASARLLNVADKMLQSLLDAVG